MGVKNILKKSEKKEKAQKPQDAKPSLHNETLLGFNHKTRSPMGKMFKGGV